MTEIFQNLPQIEIVCNFGHSKPGDLKWIYLKFFDILNK
jgi:hypothetical protein